ncbi:MAG: hypothetical protein JOZ90_06980 [Alphaproteobacteria bacterium]|nr:hypothetical protein [Alphaproteobacteria bacterium]MBV9370434.1 hypothetical protein [Alphaproteobacteria bacterium]MBV9900826.1 hypothetical protein [Alphaproteobacteria bacterium]
MRRFIAAAAGAALIGSVFAAPAEARGRWHRHHDDVDAGDVVAGAVVIGGIAALASAIGEGNRQKQDAAVDSCSREAESRLDGRVTDIAGVTKRKGYYTVEGNVEGGVGFSCTIRNGSVYSFRSAADGA